MQSEEIPNFGKPTPPVLKELGYDTYWFQVDYRLEKVEFTLKGKKPRVDIQYYVPSISSIYIIDIVEQQGLKKCAQFLKSEETNND